MANKPSNPELPGDHLSVGVEQGYMHFGDRMREPFLARERRVVQAINTLSDKHDWHLKAFDDSIVAKWRDEAMADNVAVRSRPDTASESAESNDEDDDPDTIDTDESHIDPEDRHDAIADTFSSEMFDFCIAELRDKAREFERTGIIRVLDLSAATAKSDTIVSKELHDQLRSAVTRLLEDIPNDQKDWHPGSNHQVLDLVHPSLFPLVYGRSRILRDHTISLEDCLTSIGAGETISRPAAATLVEGASADFQWLPTNFQLTPAGPKAESYINNLHPTHHNELYPLIEKLIGCAIPLWCDILKYSRDSAPTRFQDRDPVYDYDETSSLLPERKEFIAERRSAMTGVKVTPAEISDNDWGDKEGWEYPDDIEDGREVDWPHRKRRMTFPEPRSYAEWATLVAEQVNFPDMTQEFPEKNLQVIFKLANIILEPDMPMYEGGVWHVEGLPNESIIATAIYYYDSVNITPSYLGFRQEFDGMDLIMRPPQSDYEGYEVLYGVQNEDLAIQDLGQLLTREGRMIAFPNCMQHCVAPFALQDATKSGHRKIVALFLVDPTMDIVSTSVVPPQRRDWWGEQLLKAGALNVPGEIAQSIIDRVEDFPISTKDAEDIRERLMAERSSAVDTEQARLFDASLSFCEH